MSIDLNAVLQTILIASVLGAASWVRSGLSKLQREVANLSKDQAVLKNDIQHTTKELSHHNRRIEHLENRGAA